MNYKILLKSILFYMLITVTQSGQLNGKTLEKGIGETDYRERVYSLNLQIELQYTDDVEKMIEFYVEKNKKLSATLLGRAEMYFPYIEPVLVNENLPNELKYLPVLETGLLPYAQSGAGAAGLWQFMEGTGSSYGLRITNAVDERRDPEKSTQAAAAYLKKLYSIYKDWTLVLAAYNCGDGTLNKAIKKAESVSYWAVQKYLPKQTQEFVPKFIAIAYMMNYHYLHNIETNTLHDDYKFTATLKVKNKVDLDKLSKMYEIDKEVIRRLNPAYTKGFIPAVKDSEYTLTLPEQKMIEFANDNNVYEDIFKYSPHVMARNKAALALADQARIIQEQEAGAQPLSQLPTAPLYFETNAAALRIDERANTVKVIKLKKGQSLSDIAKEYNQELVSLIQFNDFDENRPPRVGDQVKVKI